MTVISAGASASPLAAVKPPKPAPTITIRARDAGRRCGAETGIGAAPGVAVGPGRNVASMSQRSAATQDAGNDIVDGDRAGTACEDEQEQCRPAQVLGPVLRINEGLDDERHPQQRQ